MCDAVLFCEAAGVDQSAFRFHISQRKTNINSLSRGGFDLCEDVIAIKRNDRLTRTRFRFLTNLLAQLQERIVERFKMCLRTRVHFLNIALRSLEIQIRIA